MSRGAKRKEATKKEERGRKSYHRQIRQSTACICISYFAFINGKAGDGERRGRNIDFPTSVICCFSCQQVTVSVTTPAKVGGLSFACGLASIRISIYLYTYLYIYLSIRICTCVHGPLLETVLRSSHYHEIELRNTFYFALSLLPPSFFFPADISGPNYLFFPFVLYLYIYTPIYLYAYTFLPYRNYKLTPRKANEKKGREEAFQRKANQIHLQNGNCRDKLILLSSLVLPQRDYHCHNTTRIHSNAGERRKRTETFSFALLFFFTARTYKLIKADTSFLIRIIYIYIYIIPYFDDYILLHVLVVFFCSVLTVLCGIVDYSASQTIAVGHLTFSLFFIEGVAIN